ncbi:IS66 family insertion sequence element accessory protein TnpA [Pectobacterium araliae]|uniref:IS66 family insertion sequence element accessory protein TnpA n=1 Tax=Pectobacterium araliae TaxID=3073862 RepID=UPI0021C492CD
MSKKHYCRLHDLNPATFYYWLKHSQYDATVTMPSAFIPARLVARRTDPLTHLAEQPSQRAAIYSYRQKDFPCLPVLHR